MSELCIHCVKRVTPRQQGLQCELCGLWIHRICGTGVSQDVYRQAVREERNIDWYCISCHSDISPNENEHISVAEVDSININNNSFMTFANSTPVHSPHTTLSSVVPTFELNISSFTHFNTDFINANSTFSIDDIGSFELDDETNSTVHDLNPECNLELNLESILSSGDSFEMDTLQSPVHTEEESLEDIDPSNTITSTHPLIDFEIVRTGSERGRSLLIDSRGFKYTVKFKGKFITRWTCSKRSKLHTCRATVIQIVSTFKPGPQPHTHPSSSALLISTKVRIEIKEKAASQVFRPAQAISNDILINTIGSSLSVESLPQPVALARSANRHLQRFRPKDPSTLDFVISYDHVPAGFLQRDIVGIDYRHIIFATASMLELLARAKVWYLDATFKVVKYPFSQLFSIHAFVKHGAACKQVPMIFILMSKRRNSDYQLVLRETENILPTYPAVTRIVLDFELAMWTSIPIVFPEVCLMGCAFHWNQAVWRKILELGLVIAYRQDDSHRKYIKRLMSLPYLSAEHIVETFRRLRQKANTPQLKDLTNYIYQTWIINSMWKPNCSSVYNQLIRTNNNVEGWHSSLNRAAARSNLEFYLLVELLSREFFSKSGLYMMKN